MWKLLYYLFKWDYVMARFADAWVIRKVTWFHQDAFCRPCMERLFINKSDCIEGYIIWKPLTPNMFTYKLELEQKEKAL